MIFTAELKLTGKNTGFVVPPQVLDELGGGKRPKVRVSVNGYAFSLTLGSMNGDVMIPVSAARRREGGLVGGESYEIDLRLDSSVEQIELPDDFRSALSAAGLDTVFAALAPSHRKEHVRAITEAKAAETRARRIAKAIEMVRAKQK